MLVTASVDKLVLKKPINVNNDLEISGAVTWVGRSSMEIQLEVTQSTQGASLILIVVFSDCLPRESHSKFLSLYYFQILFILFCP